jgi:hypothetical protein
MKARIRENIYGNWYGYLGNRRVEMFFNSSTETMEQAAKRWLTEQQAKRQTKTRTPRPLFTARFKLECVEFAAEERAYTGRTYDIRRMASGKFGVFNKMVAR